MKSTALFLIAILAAVPFASGQVTEKTVTGTLTDAETGEPMPGVNIVNESTRTGTISGSYGKFSLNMPETGSTIAFSFIGYKTEKVVFTGQSVIDVKLAQEVQTLDEVVLIGYGTIKKSDLTGAISSVSPEEIEKSSAINIQTLLQGRVPGLMATSNSGAPGSEAVIRIRGVGTVNNSSPIYVVDGTIIDNSDPNNLASNIGFLNPSDIESVEVLKDASAQAIYGSRGANGVILVSTRKGSQGLPKVTFSTTIGVENAVQLPSLLNATEYKDLILTSHSNGYLRTPNADSVFLADTLDYWTKETVARYDQGANTNWLEEVT